MRAAIYARVSKEDQNCEMQLRELREYCARRAWTISREYVDSGWGGAKASRPELDRLKQEARTRRFDCVLVWKLDRWGRSVIDSIGSIRELVSIGIRWIAVTQNLDTDESNPMARFMLHVMAAFAELEREMIRERASHGLKRYGEDFAAGRVGRTVHSRSGKDLPIGRPRKIFNRDRAMRLHVQGASIREIAERMNVPRSTIHRLVESARKANQKPRPKNWFARPLKRC